MYTRENFLYTKLLESSTEFIKCEFENLYGDVANLPLIKPPRQQMALSPEWVGSFVYFVSRKPQWDEASEARSIILKRLVETIPSNHLQGIWFSAILPNGVIPWHVDKYEDAGKHIRVHLPLIVPHGDLGITIDQTTHEWIPGKIICFDPFVRHTAWNKSNEIRLNVNFNFAPEAFIC